MMLKILTLRQKTFDVFTVGIPAALIVASVVVFIVMKKAQEGYRKCLKSQFRKNQSADHYNNCSFALPYNYHLCACLPTSTLEDNYFKTGLVDINLNDGKPVISEHEFLFEPGMTVKKDFFIENNSTWSVYYKLYFDHVDGGLADVLEITVKDGDNTLCSGTAASLSRENSAVCDDVLSVSQKKNLSIYFHYPEGAGNKTQDQTPTFDFCADGVQTKTIRKNLFLNKFILGEKINEKGFEHCKKHTCVARCCLCGAYDGVYRCVGEYIRPPDRSLFGYKAFIVLSDSMKATDFDAGDLVLVKEVDPRNA